MQRIKTFIKPTMHNVWFCVMFIIKVMAQFFECCQLLQTVQLTVINTWSSLITNISYSLLPAGSPPHLAKTSSVSCLPQNCLLPPLISSEVQVCSKPAWTLTRIPAIRKYRQLGMWNLSLRLFIAIIMSTRDTSKSSYETVMGLSVCTYKS